MEEVKGVELASVSPVVRSQIQNKHVGMRVYGCTTFSLVGRALEAFSDELGHVKTLAVQLVHGGSGHVCECSSDMLFLPMWNALQRSGSSSLCSVELEGVNVAMPVLQSVVTNSPLKCLKLKKCSLIHMVNYRFFLRMLLKEDIRDLELSGIDFDEVGDRELSQLSFVLTWSGTVTRLLVKQSRFVWTEQLATRLQLLRASRLHVEIQVSNTRGNSYIAIPIPSPSPCQLPIQ